MSLLGIDVGSSALKAVLFDGRGREIATASAEYTPVTRSAGFAELDPDRLWKMTATAIRTIAGEHPVRAIAFSVHGESFVPVAPDGKALGPAILNIDNRATAEMDDFAKQFGREQLYRTTGLPPHPMYTLPKIAWMRRHQPVVFNAAAKFLCLHDYLLLRGAGEARIDTSLASRTMAFDIQRRTWDGRLLQQAGLNADRLAPVAAAGEVVGTTRREARAETGLGEHVYWVTGGHDQACTSIGAGGLRPGTIVDGTGTFECLSIASETALGGQALRWNLPCERHAVPDRFLSLAYAPGGVTLKWFRDQLARDVIGAEDQVSSSYDRLLANIPQEPTGLFVLPYLFGTGTPWLDAAASGVIHGLRFDTTREALVRALLEGVTFEMRWNLQVLENLGLSGSHVRAVGGGAKSALWLQLKADIFGREVTAIPGEAACRGAAICAGIGSGEFTTFLDGEAAMVVPGATYQPRPDVHARYSDLLRQYQQLAKRLYGFELPNSSSHTHALGS